MNSTSRLERISTIWESVRLRQVGEGFLELIDGPIRGSDPDVTGRVTTDEETGVRTLVLNRNHASGGRGVNYAITRVELNNDSSDSDVPEVIAAQFVYSDGDRVDEAHYPPEADARRFERLSPGQILRAVNRAVDQQSSAAELLETH